MLKQMLFSLPLKARKSDKHDQYALALLARIAHFAPGEAIPKTLLHNTLPLTNVDVEKVSEPGFN